MIGSETGVGSPPTLATVAKTLSRVCIIIYIYIFRSWKCLKKVLETQ
nr:MAG TPA: hypothetical protein [Caudoviricetes sp.]